MDSNFKFFFMFICTFVLWASPSHADEDKSHQFVFPISTSIGLGTLKNEDVNAKSRTMTIYNVEALPSLKWDEWTAGLHLDVRLQDQLTSLGDAGGTNWRGNAYLIGLGVRRDFPDKWFIQGSVDLIGKYDLTQGNTSGHNDYLHAPLSLRLKSGKAFLADLPNLTFDADFQYLSFRKANIGGVDKEAKSEQLMLSVGLTCVLPCWKSNAVPADAAVN